MKKSARLLSIIQGVSTRIREIKEQAFFNTGYQDLSAASIHYIDVIGQMDAPTLVELANRLNLSKPSVTNMVGKLQEKGFVEKSPAADDGRSIHISLTEKGAEIADAYGKAHEKVVDHIANRLEEDEVETLIRLLRKIG